MIKLLSKKNDIINVGNYSTVVYQAFLKKQLESYLIKRWKDWRYQRGNQKP